MADEHITEEWRLIEAFPEYEVSSLGKVRRAVSRYFINRRTGERYVLIPAGKILSPALTDGGRKWVVLSNGIVHKKRTCTVATLVCTAFHGPRPSPRHEAAHWGGDSGNDTADNLRWATGKENSEDMLRHGRRPQGETSYLSILTERDVLEIRRRLAEGGVTQQALADEYGLKSRVTIADIKSRKH